MSDCVSFACPGCRVRLRTFIRYVGRSRACPSCGQNVVIRPQAPEEEGPVFVLDEEAAWPDRRPSR